MQQPTDQQPSASHAQRQFSEDDVSQKPANGATAVGNEFSCSDIKLEAFYKDPSIDVEFAKAVAKIKQATGDIELGRVVQQDRSLPLVCTSRGNVRAEHAAVLIKRTDTLAAVGDWVAIEFPPDHENAVIRRILPRKNSLQRYDRGRKSGVQTLASNIDTVFIVVPCQGVSEPMNLNHLERQITLAFQSQAQPVVVLSKADLCDDVDAEVAGVKTVTLNLPLVVESVEDGFGADQIEHLIQKGRVGVLLGKSGVGKSSLINAIVGGSVQRTSEVRESDGKGRHTTIARRMVELPSGGFLIDSPGLRSFNLNDSTEGVELAFSDITELSAQCRFRDCKHKKEPGCAVRAAVENGTITQRRYESYISIMDEALEKSRKW